MTLPPHPYTIALLHPGEMGAAVGASLRSRGHRIRWAAVGRSVASQDRARAGGLLEVASLAAALDGADLALSVVPPHAALAQAQEVAALGFRGLYLDANAIAPDTAREVGRIVTAAGARFVDGGIIGAPPRTGGGTRLYLSGSEAAALAPLLDGPDLGVMALAGADVAASALKLAYAAWTKGSIALLAAVRAFAVAEDVQQPLLDEWAHSQPGLAERSGAIAGSARKAWRWVGEMEQIAQAFEARNLPSGFHLGAAQLYSALAGFKDPASSPPAMDAVVSSLLNPRE